MSHNSGISEWRQAGPLIALITGTSMLSRFISKCRPSQWMRSMRSIDGRDGEGRGARGRARAGKLGAGPGQDHDPVVAIGADLVKQFGQFAMRQKAPAQRLAFGMKGDLKDAVPALQPGALVFVPVIR